MSSSLVICDSSAKIDSGSINDLSSREYSSSSRTLHNSTNESRSRSNQLNQKGATSPERTSNDPRSTSSFSTLTQSTSSPDHTLGVNSFDSRFMLFFVDQDRQNELFKILDSKFGKHSLLPHSVMENKNPLSNELDHLVKVWDTPFGFRIYKDEEEICDHLYYSLSDEILELDSMETDGLPTPVNRLSRNGILLGCTDESEPQSKALLRILNYFESVDPDYLFKKPKLIQELEDQLGVRAFRHRSSLSTSFGVWRALPSSNFSILYNCLSIPLIQSNVHTFEVCKDGKVMPFLPLEELKKITSHQQQFVL